MISETVDQKIWDSDWDLKKTKKVSRSRWHQSQSKSSFWKRCTTSMLMLTITHWSSEKLLKLLAEFHPVKFWRVAIFISFLKYEFRISKNEVERQAFAKPFGKLGWIQRTHCWRSSFHDHAIEYCHFSFPDK